MRKYIKSFLIALTVIILIPAIVVLAGYNSSISVRNTGATGYSMLACNVSANVAYWESDGFIGVNGTDVRIYRGTVEIPHMMVTDRITMALPLPAYSSQTLQFVTGETPQDFYIVPGYSSNTSVGRVQIADNPNIEFGNNFSVNMTNIYLNTDNGTGKNLLRKDGALNVYVSDTVSGNITAETYLFGDYFDTDLWTDVGTKIVVNTTTKKLEYESERSATDTRCYYDLTAISDTAWELNFSINNTTSTASSSLFFGMFSAATNWHGYLGDALVVRVGGATPYIDLLSRIAGAVTDSTDINISDGTQYWVTVTRDSAIAATLNVYSDADRTAHVAGSPQSIVVDAAVNNLRYLQATNQADGAGAAEEQVGWIDEVTVNPIRATVTDIPSGEHDITVSADTTHLILDIDGTSNSAALNGVSVPDNANDIYLFENNSVAYCKTFEIQRIGVQQLYYAPNDIIDGTSGILPDRGSDATDNYGVILFGSNPANIALTLGAFSSDYTVSTEISQQTSEVAPEVSINTITKEDAAKIVDLSAKDPALYPLFNAINGVVGIPIMFMYQGVFLALAVGIVFVFGKFGHLTIGVVASLVVIGFATAWGVYDIVMLTILIISGIGLILMQGRQSV